MNHPGYPDYPVWVAVEKKLAMHRLPGIFAAALVALAGFDSEANERNTENDDGKVNVGAQRPFDAVNIFGDFGRNSSLPNSEENKIWWERMARGEVGKDRFLILCALKEGNWKSLADIRTYLDYKSPGAFSAKRLHRMLVLMAGRAPKHTPRVPNSPQGEVGEGWLEKNPHADTSGISSEWKIEPSVYPLLYFLLMSCPADDKCE